MSSAVTRRDFVTAALVAGAGLARAADALSGPHAVDAHTPATAGLEWRNRHPEMRYRRLGRTGFMISEIVCGGDPIAPDNNRHVEAAIDFGLNYLYTAPTYGDGKSEEGYSVWEYTDEILADADERTKNLWTHGLAFLNSAAERKHGRHFEDCTAEQQVALVERISQHEENPIQPEDRFLWPQNAPP